MCRRQKLPFSTALAISSRFNKAPTSTCPQLIKPGPFGVIAAADSRRGIFDAHNEALLAHAIPVAAVFIGDSITDGWALDVFFQGTGGMLANRGISGDRTPFVRRRFAADVLQLHPRLVVVMIGVNNTWDLDIWWDSALIRSPQEIEEEIVDDVATMAAAARAAGIVVALCSILPTDIPFNGHTAVRNRLIARANGRLQALAQVQGEGVVYVDYHRHMIADDGLTLRPGAGRRRPAPARRGLRTHGRRAPRHAGCSRNHCTRTPLLAREH